MTAKPTSLQRQLMWYLLVPLATISLINAAVAFYLANKFSNIAYDRALFDTTKTLATQIHVTQGRARVDLPQVAWDMLRYDEFDRIFVSVSAGPGQLIAGDAGLPVPPEDLHRPGEPILHNGIYHGEPVRVASLYLPSGGEYAPNELLVQTAETLVKRRTLAREIAWGIVLPQLVLLVLPVLSVWSGVRRALTPLERIWHALRRRSHRDLSPLTETSQSQEIQTLIHSINDLMHRLDQALGAQQRFIADAAHQLRTPIAGLKAQTQVALRQPELAAQQALPQIARSVERANHLIHQLLTLARSEALSSQQQTFAPVNLSQLLREVTAEWVPAAMQKNIDLGYNGTDEPVTISGNALLLQEMMANLIDNAIRYTPDGGSVTISLPDATPLRIVVEDDGPGISREERERVFERFHRVLGNSSDGSGLGLAIVREIASAHGARVWITEGLNNKGTRINVEFSAAQQPGE